jgi:hypothetical protein
VEVYAASGEQPALDRRHDELTIEEKEVDLFFSDKQNVDRLVELLALEEKKGKDKFNGYRFIMFKVRIQKSLYVICFFVLIVTSKGSTKRVCLGLLLKTCIFGRCLVQILAILTEFFYGFS